ncbi:hypothetical protein ASG53_09190 [Sanguibacter sp. Leaf3]|nr:hypothetical protein [Sanguibacter sp. Leaf3]KQT97916.1 hypothetical protein ASG53_09190 [Sanguibacter sp. Leaf3]
MAYEVGQELTYSFLVTNSGNVTMTDVTVDEGEFDGTGELGAITPASVATLAPGDSTTFTATYTLTQADVDRGSTTNTATATGVPPTGPPVESPPSTVEIPSAPTPALTVVKSADLTEITAAGQVVRYSFVVTNTGNVTVTDAAPVETEFSGTGDLGAITPESATLIPGQSATFTADYTVTQADVDGGVLANTATAGGTPPPGTELPPVPPSTVEIPSIAAPALTVVKSVDPAGQESYEVGQELTYSFLVTNSGNVTMTDVTVDEGEFDGTWVHDQHGNGHGRPAHRSAGRVAALDGRDPLDRRAGADNREDGRSDCHHTSWPDDHLLLPRDQHGQRHGVRRRRGRGSVHWQWPARCRHARVGRDTAARSVDDVHGNIRSDPGRPFDGFSVEHGNRHGRASGW